MSPELAKVKSLVHSFLKPAGFTRSGNIWNKRLGNIVQTFDIQVEGYIRKHMFNVGILDEETDLICWGTRRKKVVAAADCPINERASMLVDGHARLWDNEKGGNDIGDKQEVIHAALSLLARVQSRQGMIDWLSSRSRTENYWFALLSLGILQTLEGHSEAADQTFEKFAARFSSEGFQARLAEVKIRLEAAISARGG